MFFFFLPHCTEVSRSFNSRTKEADGSSVASKPNGFHCGTELRTQKEENKMKNVIGICFERKMLKKMFCSDTRCANKLCCLEWGETGEALGWFKLERHSQETFYILMQKNKINRDHKQYKMLAEFV